MRNLINIANRIMILIVAVAYAILHIISISGITLGTIIGFIILLVIMLLNVEISKKRLSQKTILLPMAYIGLLFVETCDNANIDSNTYLIVLIALVILIEVIIYTIVNVKVDEFKSLNYKSVLLMTVIIMGSIMEISISVFFLYQCYCFKKYDKELINIDSTTNFDDLSEYNHVFVSYGLVSTSFNSTNLDVPRESYIVAIVNREGDLYKFVPIINVEQDSLFSNYNQSMNEYFIGDGSAKEDVPNIGADGYLIKYQLHDELFTLLENYGISKDEAVQKYCGYAMITSTMSIDDMTVKMFSICNALFILLIAIISRKRTRDI